MAVIGQINTIVSATTKPLTSALGRASGAFRSFGGRIGGLVGGFGRLGIAIAGAAGATGFGLLVKSSFETIDDLAKVADSLGITTEALAGLRRASELSGVGSDKLDKSLLRMQRRISEAADGSLLAKDNFAQMGLSIEQLRTMTPEEQFITVADAIRNMSDQTDRTRLAMDTFGRDGAKVLAIVKNGAAATRSELVKAAELGLAPSREDAAKIEAANDAITDMKSAFMGIANTVAISVAPAITSISGSIQAFAKRARSVFSGVMPVLRQFGNLWSTIFSQAWQTASAIFELIGISGGSSLKSITDSVIDFFIAAEFSFKNVGPIAALMWEKIKLGAISFWEDTKFLFTTQIPEVLMWFADNFRDIMFTAIDYVLTVFQNLGKNIRSVWSGVLNFFKGKGFSVDWTPLQEGFVSQIKELPKISKRELTEVEKVMTSRVEQMNQNLATGLAEFTKMRREELLGPQIDKQVEVKPPEQDMLASLLGDKIQEGVEGGIQGAVEGPEALQRGSAEAFSAILAAQRNNNNPMERVAKENEKQTKTQEMQLRELKELKRNLSVEFIGGEV